MRWVAKGVAASGLLAVSLLNGGCKREPNPPTEQDAIGVWKSIHAKTQNVVPTDLLSFKKTNGQKDESSGVTIYTLYYSAVEKYGVPIFNHPEGWTKTVESNYPFQWTEKGWQGPDGQVYPEH
jgi:hypothetical protein